MNDTNPVSLTDRATSLRAFGFALPAGAKIAATTIAALSFVMASPQTGAEGVRLVEKGTARAVIIVAADASDQARDAAKLLQDYVARISGARLEIRSENEPVAGPQILVGRTRKARDFGIDLAPRFTRGMNEEEYIIKTQGDALILAGNEHPFYRGTVYAVDDLLDRLGCRWFFPGAFGEVLPHLDTIEIGPLNVHEHPDFRFRNIWYSGWMPVQGKDAEEFAVWMDRNRVNSLKGISLPGDGTITRLAPPEKYFAKHPNIYAMDRKGERMKDMLCLTDPETISIAVETIKQEFRAHPEATTFGFGPPDGHPQCFCPRCEAANPNFSGMGLGQPSLSDLWFRFANAVATEVAKEFPDRWLLTNGYANRARPPEGIGPLSPNLGIQSAMLGCCTFHPIDDPKCWQRQLYKTMLDRWTRDLRCVFIYDYDPGKALDGLPFPMLHNLQPDFRYFKERGVWGFWTEGQNCWMVTHLNYYIRARLMWNAYADVRALVRDYCQKFYGPAARPVEHYIWTMEKAVADAPVHVTFGRLVPWRAIYTPAILRKLDRDIAEAKHGNLPDPAGLHVRVLDSVHQYIRAFIAAEEAAADGDFAGAALQTGDMLRLRDALGKINPSLIPVTPEWASKGDGALEWCHRTYTDLADRINGTRGRLVAMTSRRWQFQKDQSRMGTYQEWYTPNAKGKWQDLDTTMFWEAQGLQDSHGFGYDGHAWYRTSVAVPAEAAGKPLRLAIGGLYGSALWTWVNGRLLDHRERLNARNPFDIDLSGLVNPGQTNQIALLVEPLPSDRNARGGLHRRVFLWQPNESAITPTVRIAGIVLKWVRGDKEANMKRLEPMVREAAAGGARIVVTTECFLDGYAIQDKSIPLDTYRALGEPIPDGKYFQRLTALARELKITLVAGFTEADGDLRYNTAVLIGPDGSLLGKYRKHALEHELVRNTPGTNTPAFKTEFGKLGLMICADRKHPDLVKSIIAEGAEFMLCPSGGMFGPKSNDHFLQERSKESKIYIVFVHPCEFLVTAPDGAICTTTVLGDKLLVPPSEIDTETDSKKVFYFELPISPK
jgi:predicted amidohydrolase